MNTRASRISRFVVALSAVALFSSENRAEVPQELVSNGSFEANADGWSASKTGRYSYLNNETWISSKLVKKEGVGNVAMLMSCQGSSTLKQSIELNAKGLYSFSCVYAARTQNHVGTFYGAKTTVTLEAEDVSLPIAEFSTTIRHRHWQDRINANVAVTDASKTYALQFVTSDTADRSQLIDLVSLKLILPFEAGYCAVGGSQDGDQYSYETLQPVAGTVLSVGPEVPLTRTMSAKLVGYKLYRYFPENNYEPTEPELVPETSYTVTSDDLQSPFRLEWQWQQVDRTTALDTSLFSRKCELLLSGYEGNETLTHFPLLVRLSSDSPVGFAYGNAAVDGSDIRFTDADGNVIPHEIDTWNQAGESTVWVRVPVVSGTDTKIFMYYGVEDSDRTSLPQNYGSDVWSDHLGVWHMNINPDDKSTIDATGRGMNGTMNNPNYCDAASLGLIGGAFTNSSTAYLKELFSDDIRFMPAPFAFSCWAYNYAGSNFAVIWAGSNWSAFEIIFDGAKTKLLTRPCSSAHVVPTFDKIWRHVNVVYDGEKSCVYMDGELVASKNCAAPSFASMDAFYIGQRNGSPSCNWMGSLDEMRIRTTNLTADWIKADYESQKADSAFVTYGEVEVIKTAALAIADRGLTVDGTLVTMRAHVSPATGKDAVCRVAYGVGNQMSQFTAERTVTAEGDCSETISLDWATAYCAQWQAWSVDAEENVLKTETCRFVTDGTPQVVSDLNWSISGNVVNVSSVLTAKRGAGVVVASLYRTMAGAGEELVESQEVPAIGVVSFAEETLDWGADYSYRVVYVSTRDGVGSWTNQTKAALVRVPSKPVEFRASTFTAHSEITLSGYRGSEQLRDIPVLVRLSAGHPARFDASLCGTGGSLIRFTDELGGLIPHEVDTWDPSGESLVWVRVPILKGANTKITLHMAPSNPARVPAVDSRQVWSEYLGVWHMDVAPDWSVRESGLHGLGGSVKNGYPVSADPTVDPDNPSQYSISGSDGVIGGSHTNSGWAYVRVAANNAFAALTSNVTFSAWVRSSANQSSDAVIWNDKASGTGFGEAYGVEIGLTGISSLYVRGAGSSGLATEVPELTKQAWHMVTVAYDGDSFAVYVDDGEGHHPAAGMSISPVKFRKDDALALGQRIGWKNGITGEPSTVCNFLGCLDEMRIGTKTESADWVQACYDTVADADFAHPARVRKTCGLVIYIQ